MATDTQAAVSRVRLRSGETVLWSGRPRQGVVFHLYEVSGFILFLGAYALVSLQVALSRFDQVIVGLLLFPLAGAIGWLIVRALLDARRRSTQTLVLTSERLVTVDGAVITWDTIETIAKLSLVAHVTSGTIYFGNAPTPVDMLNQVSGTVKRLMNDDDADVMPKAIELGPDAREVYALLSKQHEVLRPSRPSPSQPPRTPSAP